MMKLLFLISWLLLMVQGLVAAPKNDDLCFDATVCDFGTVVRENTIHTHVFHFENQSEEPVVILGVQTSCSCLKTEYSRRPLQKGEQGEITIRLEVLKIEEGVFHRIIKVQTNKGLCLLTVKGQSVSSSDSK